MDLLAYIDPGTGLLIWQTVVAVVLGLLFYVKKVRKWFVGIFRRLFGADKPAEQSALKVQPPERDVGR